MALRHYHRFCYLYIDACMLGLPCHSGNGSSDCNAVKLCCICLWLCIAHKHANWWYENEWLNSASVVETLAAFSNVIVFLWPHCCLLNLGLCPLSAQHPLHWALGVSTPTSIWYQTSDYHWCHQVTNTSFKSVLILSIHPSLLQDGNCFKYPKCIAVLAQWDLWCCADQIWILSS